MVAPWNDLETAHAIMEMVSEHLHGLGRYLREGMARVLRERQVTGQVIGDGPLAHKQAACDDCLKRFDLALGQST
ncbi:MAG: hypothetical protein OEM59_04965 [Rhodospirillales bacterium]|nr:hypothetical protein [Rhodospirillales bacterium]